MAQLQVRPRESLWPAAAGGAKPAQRRPSPALRPGPAALIAILLVGAVSEGGAGRLLDRALADAGLDGEALPRVLAPPASALSVGLIVALGADAASSLLRRPINLALERGRILALPHGGRLLVTEQPSAIMGLVDGVARGREYRRLVNDLLHVVPFQRRAA